MQARYEKINFDCFFLSIPDCHRISECFDKTILIYLNKYEIWNYNSVFDSPDDSTEAAQRVLWPVAVLMKRTNWTTIPRLDVGRDINIQLNDLI